MWRPHTHTARETAAPWQPEPVQRPPTAPEQLQPARRELGLKVGSDRSLDKDMLKQLVDAIRGSGGAVPVRNQRPDQRKRGNAAHVYQNIPPGRRLGGHVL